MRTRLAFGAWLLLAAAGVFVIAAPRADAAFLPQQRIDGPDPAILEVSDIAVSQDGSGGIVYRKTIDGADHVFAAVYRDGVWGAPQRVDVAQSFRSTAPRIGAADGGRLVVTWIQENGPDSDRIYSASLDSGATRFEQPVALDINVGEAQYVHPDLAMNRAGVAYIVYRIVSNPIVTGLPDYVEADYRVARYNGWTWSRLDQPIDRNTGVFMLAPTTDNAPKIAVDGLGNAVVAFQEPDDEFVGRVWVRRIFGATPGIPQQASPSTYEGRPLRAAADQIGLAVGHYGNVGVAVRQDPGLQAAFDRPRVFVNQMPDVYSESAARFIGARRADDSAGSSGGSAWPSVAVSSRGALFALFSAGGEAHAASGDDYSLTPSAVLGSASPAVSGADIGQNLRTAAGWLASGADGGAVVLREDDGVNPPVTSAVRDPAGGTVNRLVFSGSGYGDALAGFMQTAQEGKLIAAAGVDTSPDRFAVHEPTNWTRARKIELAWDAATEVFGGATYEVRSGGRLIAITRDLSALTDRLREGKNVIDVTAIDRLGQRTAALPVTVGVDRRKPTVTMRKLSGRRVRVVFSDGLRSRSSGPSSRSRVSWGDGKSSRLRRSATHRFGRGGSFKLRINVSDAAGNRRSVTRRIRL